MYKNVFDKSMIGEASFLKLVEHEGVTLKIFIALNFLKIK